MTTWIKEYPLDDETLARTTVNLADGATSFSVPRDDLERFLREAGYAPVVEP